MHIGRRVAIVATFAAVAACGGGDGSYATGAQSGGGGGGGGGGGSALGTVTVGSGIQYVSGHNSSMNPAVDTIAAGSTVTWTWAGALPHGVRSVGTPSFTNSETHTGSGTYVATFTMPGTYKYDCSVHGGAMTGTIVVVPTPSQLGGSSYDATATLVDPIGDTFGANAKWDLTALTLAREAGGLTAMLADDDGYVNAAAIVGIVGAPADILPTAGNLTLLASSHDPIPEIAR